MVSLTILALHPLIHMIETLLAMWIDLPAKFAFLRKGFVLIFRMLTLAITVAYVIVRLFLVFEVFRTLYFLRPRAFVATWPSSIPHVERAEVWDSSC